MKFLFRIVQSIVLVSGMLAISNGTGSLAFPPDTHECGSEAGNFPNRPKVWLYFTQKDPDKPKDFWQVFIDKTGQGYFEMLKNTVSKKQIAENFGKTKDGRTYELWGEYSFDRHDRERNPYFIDIIYEEEIVAKYRVRGPHIVSAAWKKVEKTEEKSK